MLARIEEVHIKPLEKEIRDLQDDANRIQAKFEAAKAIADHYEKLFWNLGVPRATGRRRRIRGKEKR